MDWHTLSDAYLHLGFLAAAPVVLALAVIVLRLAPFERERVLRITVLFATSLGGIIVAVALGALGFTSGAQYVRGVFVLLAGIWAIEVVGLAFFQVLLRRLGFPQPRILQDVVVVITVIVWGLVRLHFAGVDLAGIVTTSAVLTAVIGLSLQDTLGNILGGLALQLDRSFRVGDWIEVDGATGQVIEIGWRRTSVYRLSGNVVLIPNSVLVKHKFVLLGQDPDVPAHQRRWIPFHVDYSHSPTRVIEVVETALAHTDIPFVARVPAPCCLLTELATNPASYAVGYWLSSFREWRGADSAVRVHIYVALKRAGIPLAVPSQNVLLTQTSEERDAALSAREIERRLGALGSVGLFDGFGADEKKTVAGRLRSVPFAAGDVLVRQGAKANSLYIVVDGEAEVYVETEQHARTEVARLGPGEFFGEYALMTGEPRTATVVAKTNVECYCLDKMAFRDLLVSRPELAEQIALVLAQRRTERDAALDHLEAKAAAASAAPGDVRSKVWRFFGLKS